MKIYMENLFFGEILISLVSLRDLYIADVTDYII